MANRYVRAAGGNWGTAATWESTPGGGESVAVPTSSDDVFLVAGSGNLTINTTANAKSFDCTGYIGELTHQGFSCTVAGNITLVSGMTYTPTTGSVFAISSTGTLTTGGKLLNEFSANASTTLGDNLSFRAARTCVLNINNSTGLNLNNKTISGYSQTARVFIASSTLGLSRTITVNGGTFANADFRDIAFANGGSDLDLSTITGLSGDCGGNSMSGGGTLTFTPADVCTWRGNTGNWSDSTKWDTTTATDRVPLPQDTAILTGTNTCTVEMPRLCADISFTGETPLTLGNLVRSFGDVDLTGMGTLTTGQAWIFESNARGGTINITTAGKESTSSYTFNPAGTAVMQIIGAISATSFTLTTYNTASVKMGDGLWTSTRSSAGSSITGTTGSTIDPETSTIYVSDTGANTKTISGGGLTYNNLTTPSGTGGVTITGSNTFNTVTVTAGGKLTLTANTTQTVNDFVAVGTSASRITLNATAGVVPILNKANSGVINCDYIDIQGVNVTPSNTWYYGANGKDGVGLDFNGASDWKVVATNTANIQMKLATSYSTEVWCVDRLSAGAAGYLFNTFNALATTGMGLKIGSANSNVSFYINEGGTLKESRSATSSINRNVLNHIVTTWTSGAASKIYINGSETSSYVVATAITTPDDDSANSFTIGQWNNSQWFNGCIMLVRIYRNIVLSAGNVTTLYNGGVMTKTSNPLGNATAEYLFTEGTESSLTDAIAANNGTISGALWANTGWNSGSAWKKKNLISNVTPSGKGIIGSYGG